MAMEMEGVMLSSISNPSPDEIANQINTLQTNLEDLETSRADLYAEVRSISTAASIGTVQRHFVVYLGEVAKCLKKAQKLTADLQSLSGVLSQVQTLTAEVSRLKKKSEDSHNAFIELQRSHLGPVKLRLEEQTELESLREQKKNFDATKLNSDEALKRQQDFLEAIQLSAKEKEELAQLRAQKQRFDEQSTQLETLMKQADTTSAQVTAIHKAVTHPEGVLAQVHTAVGPNITNLQQSVQDSQTQITNFSRENQSAMSTVQQSITDIQTQLNDAGGDESRLAAVQRTVDEIQGQIVVAAQDIDGNLASVLGTVQDIQETLTGEDIDQNPSTAFLPRMLRSIESMMRNLSSPDRPPSTERTRKAARISPSHGSLPRIGEEKTLTSRKSLRGGLRHTFSASKNIIMGGKTRGRLADMSETGSDSIQPPSTRPSVSPPQSGFSAQTQIPQRSYSPSQPGHTPFTYQPLSPQQSGAFGQVPFDYQQPLSQQSSAPGRRVALRPSAYDLGRERGTSVQSPHGGPSLSSPEPGTLAQPPINLPPAPTSQPDASTRQVAGPGFSLRFLTPPHPSGLTVSVALNGSVQLARQPNDILTGNFIKVGDRSGNYDNYQPFAVGLGDDVITRFVADLMGFICVTDEEKYTLLAGHVQRIQCMYNKIAKGNAVPEEQYACPLCVRMNRICLRKARVGSHYVMFIAPLPNNDHPLAELRAWVRYPAQPMNLPASVQR